MDQRDPLLTMLRHTIRVVQEIRNIFHVRLVGVIAKARLSRECRLIRHRVQGYRDPSDIAHKLVSSSIVPT